MTETAGTAVEAKAGTSLSSAIWRERSKAGLFRIFLVCGTTAVVASLTYIFHVPVTAGLLILILGAVVLLLTVAGVVNQSEQISALVREVVSYEGLITFRHVERVRNEAMTAITVIDYIMSALLLLSLYACVELFAGRWIAGFSAIAFTLVWIGLARLAGSIKGFKASATALFLTMLLPAATLNSVAKGQLSFAVWEQTGYRLAVTLVIAAVLLVAVYIPAEFLRQKFGSIVQILPARRGMPSRKLAIRNSVAIMEWLFYADLAIVCFTSIAFAALIYWVVALEKSHFVFILFNLGFGAVAFLSMLPNLQQQTPEAMRYVRRLGLQYAALSIVLANVLLVYGYTVGWAGVQLYNLIFGADHTYPVPDQIYSFRQIVPWSLPFHLQFESAVVTVVCILAVSWVMVIVQTKAWKELFYVSIASALVVALPYIPVDFGDMLASALPVVKTTPSYVLALVVPAVKDLVTNEMQDMIVGGDTVQPVTCPKCTHPLDADDRFCSACGAPLQHIEATPPAA